MVIQHNMSAMNANRMFLDNDNKKASLAEKLSTGYKINRAADDAAVLSLSEKMRRQIRGLTQASVNAQDGISLVQIADGAMNEIHDMLHRGTELCIKAANGTLTDEDRSYIQMEIDRLINEIDSITEKTTFNEILVFQCPPEDPTTNVVITGTLPAWVGYTSSGSLSETYTPPSSGTGTTNQYASATIDFSAFDGSAAKINELVGNGFHTTCCTCTNHYSVEFTDGTKSGLKRSGRHFIYQIGIGNCQTPEDLVQAIIKGTSNGRPNGHYTMFRDAGKELIIHDNRTTAKPDPANDRGLFGPGVATAYVTDPSDYVNVELQIGSESGQHLKIDLPKISSDLLGISSVNISTAESADTAIELFKEATEYVSRERSRMGSYQNRLEHTINNLDNIVENTQSAESVIRDTDIALTMLDFSNKNILAQAGASVLSHLNQSREKILALFQ